MSLHSQRLFTISPSRINLYLTTNSSLKNPSRSSPISSPHFSLLHSQSLHYNRQNPKNPINFTIKPQNLRHRAYPDDDAMQTQSSDAFNLDAFLSVAEFLCIISSGIVTVSYAVNRAVLNSKNTVFGVLGSGKVFAWGVVVMLIGMVIGSWIRQRQWGRICRKNVRGGGESVNLLERTEKLEEDMRNSASIIRALSRQLEKLGIRFRVTRKALKGPMAETAALAQKNSEAVQALAEQEHILEKEFGEIQKVLLAMQEQQQKQLELILAIGKSGKLFESRGEVGQEQVPTGTLDFSKRVKQLESQETPSSGASKGTDNNRP